MKHSKNKIIQLMLLAFLCVGVYSCNNNKDGYKDETGNGQIDNTVKDYNSPRDKYGVDKNKDTTKRDMTKGYIDTNDIK